jgi:hypothetical protein
MTPSVAALTLIATMSLRPSSLTRRIFGKTPPARSGTRMEPQKFNERK